MPNTLREGQPFYVTEIVQAVSSVVIGGSLRFQFNQLLAVVRVFSLNNI